MAQGSDRFYPRLFAVAGLGLLGLALFKIFAPFVGPILWSILLAFLLWPLNARLMRRLHGKRGLAAGLLTLGAAFVVAAPMAVLAIVFSGQVSDLLALVSAEAQRLQVAQPSDIFRLPAVEGALRWIEAHFSLTPAQLQEWSIEAARRLLSLLAAHGGTLVLSVLGVFVDLVLTLFLFFFFMRDGAEMIGRLDRILPVAQDRKKRLAEQMAAVTRAVVLGTLVTALVQGTLVGIGFAVVGFPSPVVFGVITAAVSLLPVGGTALVWVPGAIVLAAQGRWGWGIALAVYGTLLVGSVDNVLKPRLISGHAEIDTLPVFFGVMGGLAAFGPIGMFLGPVVIALALALVRFAEESKAAPAS